MGLIGYYKRFIKDYEKTGQPLTDLLRKDNFFFFFFVWSKEAKDAFKNLKRTMCMTPVLAVHTFQMKFSIKFDAADGGIGAVLSQ